jgi:hypothetical protein
MRTNKTVKHIVGNWRPHGHLHLFTEIIFLTNIQDKEQGRWPLAPTTLMNIPTLAFGSGHAYIMMSYAKTNFYNFY